MRDVTCSQPSRCDVLIVEDEPLQAREIAQSLSRAGLCVEVVHDAVAAFARAKADQPRVAVIDLQLPDSNGFLVAKKFQEISPKTAIIFMSGQVQGVPEALLKATSARAFVNKPLPLRFLRAAVVKLVRAIEFGGDFIPEERGWLLSGIGSSRDWKIVK